MEKLSYLPDTIDPTDLAETIADIEQTIQDATVDKEMVKRTQDTVVIVSEGVPIKIRDVLSNEELSAQAIQAARGIRHDFYQNVARIPEENVEASEAENEKKVFAYLEVLQRARKGRYNGNSTRVSTFSEFYVGEYIISSKSMKEVLTRYQPSSSFNTDHGE
ncbi:MAG: hypothetical protein QG600_651 [Patescibacteria group bacterium]|nr:hypothetical protein [Patescibacteria group bacterium]